MAIPTSLYLTLGVFFITLIIKCYDVLGICGIGFGLSGLLAVYSTYDIIVQNRLMWGRSQEMVVDQRLHANNVNESDPSIALRIVSPLLQLGSYLVPVRAWSYITGIRNIIASCIPYFNTAQAAGGSLAGAINWVSNLVGCGDSGQSEASGASVAAKADDRVSSLNVNSSEIPAVKPSEPGINQPKNELGQSTARHEEVSMRGIALAAGGLAIGGAALYFILKHLLTEPAKQDQQTKPKIRIKDLQSKSVLEQMRSIFAKKNNSSVPLVFTPELQEQLTMLKGQLVLLAQKKQQGIAVSYPTLLFYGPEASGKRLYAKSIAEAVHMQFMHIPMSAFFKFKGHDAHSALDNFLDDLAAQKEGTVVLCIDQAEMVLSYERIGDPTDERGTFISYFIEQLKKACSQCIVILVARERPAGLHKSFQELISKEILFTLPGVQERKALLKLFHTKFLGGIQKEDVEQLSDDKLDMLAQALEGASYADLERAAIELK